MNRFAKFLPSTGFLATCGALFFSILLIFGIYELTNNKSTAYEQVTPILSTGNSALALTDSAVGEKDIDGDSLKDWEEALWGTDPNSKDSDGDGTPDGEEVIKNRNPAQKGPNDSLSQKDDGGATKAASSLPLTATDYIAQDLFTKYLSTKQSGKEVPKDTQDKIVASVLIKQKEISSGIRQYFEGELMVSNDGSEGALRTYGNAMGEILKNNLSQKESEIDIFNRALQKENKNELQKLDPIIKNYKTILDESLSVSVPKKAVEAHLSFINSVSRVLVTLRAMRSAFEDPVTAMSLFSSYPKNMVGLEDSLLSAKNLFVRNNISFDPNKENGNYYAHLADLIKAVQSTLLKQS